MKKFKDKDNKVYAYESDGSQDKFIKDGLIEITEEEVVALLAPPPLTAEEKIALFEKAIQSKLDNEAKLMGYDNIHTAVTYATEPAVTKFQNDGKSFRKWRSNVWEYAYTQLALWQSGGAEPTIEDTIANMPTRG